VSFLLRLKVVLCPTGRIGMVRASAYILVLAFSTIQFDNSAQAEAGALPNRNHARDSRARFRNDMPRTIRSDHPAIVPVVAAIRAITSDPLEQIVMVNDVSHLLVDYDEDERVYGRAEYHATLDEMIARRRETGWVYLRDDCDGRAVFAAHLLAALDIPWRFEASYWQRHAWIVASVGGIEYDLLELRGVTPGQKKLSYRLVGRHFVRPTRPAPYFGWRRAWQDRTARNVEIGKCLGLLELNSTGRQLNERIATDWTKVHPSGDVSPFDQRMISASFAAFPYRDNLHPDSFATMAPRTATHSTGSTSMNASTSSSDVR
jgi:hypothetical protein